MTSDSTLRSLLSRLAPPALRSVAKLLLSTPERLGHATRRSRALGRLAASPPIRDILVLCHGNICRSPFVAVLLERLVPANGRTIRSEGFLAGGRPSPPEAVAAAREVGVDLSLHRSREVSAESLGAADLILVMEPGQRDRVAALAPAAAERTLVMGELDPAPFQRATVPDPWGRPPAEFASCYARLERCTAALAAALRR